MEPGYGYFVETDSSSTFTIPGEPVFTVNIPLKMDWDLIGWFADEDTTAMSLAGNISGCLSVNMWDNVNQTYKTYIPGWPDFDFVVSRGMGLFVDVDQQSIWHGEG